MNHDIFCFAVQSVQSNWNALNRMCKKHDFVNASMSQSKRKKKQKPKNPKKSKERIFSIPFTTKSQTIICSLVLWEPWKKCSTLLMPICQKAGRPARDIVLHLLALSATIQYLTRWLSPKSDRTVHKTCYTLLKKFRARDLSVFGRCKSNRTTFVWRGWMLFYDDCLAQTERVSFHRDWMSSLKFVQNKRHTRKMAF